MDPKDLPADELELETEVKAESKEDEVRAKVVADFGFDETADAERIDKLTQERMSSHKKLSTAVGQKIKYRDQGKPKVEEPAKPVVEPAKPAATEDVNTVVTKQLEQRDLDDMPHSAELKKEIQRVAQVQGISVKQAERDPYIAFKIGEEKKAGTVEDAAIGKTKGGGSKKVYTVDSPPDVDMSTKEGRDEWAAYKVEMKKQGN